MSVSYNTFINSPRWDELRKARLKIAKYQCEYCKSRVPLQVHHKTYERFGGNERMSDLLALCARCHKLFDEKRKNGESQKLPTHKRTYKSRKIKIYVRTSKKKNWGQYKARIIEARFSHVVFEGGNQFDSGNRLALKGVIECLKELPPRKRITLSNKYVYDSLTSKNPKANLDLITELRKLAKPHKITFGKIKF